MEQVPVTSPEQLAQLAHLPHSWNLSFRQLDLPKENIWQELKFEETDFRQWWARRHAEPSIRSTKPWSDMQRLMRRIVMQVLEKVQLIVIKDESSIIDHLKVIAKSCRDVLLYHIVLCYNLPPKDAYLLQELFEYTVPIVYLVSKVTQTFLTAPSCETTEVPGTRTQCQRLERALLELHSKYRILGNEVSFDVKSFLGRLSLDSIFDFDASPRPSLSDKGGSSAEAKMTWKNDTSAKFEDVCPESESRNIDSASSSGQKLSADAFYHVRKLETRVLEEIGLKQLKHIVYDSRKWKGDGKYADVFEMQRDKGMDPVAVKIYKPNTHAKRILLESRVWMTVKHPRIVPLLGFVCFEPSLALQPCLVSKLYPTDLKKIVRDYGKNGPKANSDLLTDERKLEFLRDVIQALEFLHASGIEHGDLRADNVLVTNELLEHPSCYALLNDFGLSGHHYSNTNKNEYLDSVPNVGRARGYWIAPELVIEALEHGSLPKVSKEGDIYSFGVVFLEVMYEKDPYEGTALSVSDAKSTFKLPAEKEDLNLSVESHWELMSGCWETPDKRLGIFTVAWAILDMVYSFVPPTPEDFDDLEGEELAYWSKQLEKARLVKYR